MKLVVNLEKIWEKYLDFSLVEIYWSAGAYQRGYAHHYPHTRTVGRLFIVLPVILLNFNFMNTIKNI